MFIGLAPTNLNNVDCPNIHHVFRDYSPLLEKVIMSNYQNLANVILDYAKGLPLAITILYSYLFGRNVTEWKSALARLRESPDNDVMDVLQLSFDGLNHTEKELFLDIVCFFNSWTEKRVKNILNCCGFHADIGLKVLIDKSLISIDHSTRIEMHSLLKELGRYLPNLRTLHLSHSSNLEKIIDFGEFPNLEKLKLKECINLVELDPSIGLLRKLVYLNLNGYLNMSGCSKVFNNSRIMLSENDLKWIMLPTPTRNTYLLPSLNKRLNLRGNYFVTLPSLRKLSKLEYLNLEHCKLFESLPQLPSPTPIGRDNCESKYPWRTGLIIFNCPNLGERERCCSMAFSWMKQFIRAYRQSYLVYLDAFNIVTPGSEIPSWINNQSMGGSIQIDESPIINDNNNNIIGFVCCVLFFKAPQDPTMIKCLPLFVYMKMGIYFPREYYDVYGTIRVKGYMGEVVGFEVKSCGYRWEWRRIKGRSRESARRQNHASKAPDTRRRALGASKPLQRRQLFGSGR
ncbi:LRR and NB-ARC domain disease resistance protein [Medicago truncatula]|uniref:LRR and NB-ARC domain disease resistance protein n=1 Tax=Medicago truncatula TaxID=3880 RepID=G7KM27_MEDTR|nr:LRR and NB-ARC domain disease resistance protein [Medicago truncatula]